MARLSQPARALTPLPGRYTNGAVIQAIVFDLFHTLTAREEDWGDLPWTSDHLGIPRADWYRALTEHSRPRLLGEIVDPVAIVRMVADAVKPGLAEERIREAAAFRVERFRRAVTAIPGETLAVLRELKRRGFMLGLISNCDCSETSGWDASPLRGIFDVEIFSCDVGCVKPEPAIYRECLSRLGVRPEDALFVGDGGSGELRGAAEVGMCPVMYSGVVQSLWPDRIPALARDALHHIGRFSDLIELVEGLKTAGCSS